MQEIKLKYRPLAWLPLERTLRGRFPTAWEELSPLQFTALTTLSEKDDPAALVALFTGLPRRVVRRMDPYQVSRIWWITDWVKEESCCNRFMIPRIGSGGRTLVCPRPGLRGVSFGRFIFCDMAYEGYLETKDPQDLFRMLGSLYIPQDESFTDELPGRSLPLVRSLDEKTSGAILFNYSLVRRWLAGRYPLLFPVAEPEGEEAKGAKPAPRHKASGAWIRVFDSIVGDDISRHQEYADIPLHNVLRYLTARTKDAMKSH